MTFRLSEKNITLAEIESELLELSFERTSLLQEINKPKAYTKAKEKEDAFFSKYSKMSFSEQDKIATKRCSRCVNFSEDMEGFYSFFGMCVCMWQRYVVRTHDNYFDDEFDFNEASKLDFLDEKAKNSESRLKIVDKRIEALIKQQNSLFDETERVDKLRKSVEREKEYRVTHINSGEEIKRKKQEREKQAEKNRIKMLNTKKMLYGTK